MGQRSFDTYTAHKKEYIEFNNDLKIVFKNVFKSEVTKKLNESEIWSNFGNFLKDTFYIKKKDKNALVFDDWENQELIKYSILKLESFFYTKYLSFLMTAGYLSFIGFLTICFIILEIF